MKKYFAILLIIAFGLMSPIKPLALSIYQQIWKLNVYHNLKNEIKFNHKIQLTFLKNELKSGQINLEFIKDNEFKYNGIFYDIINKTENADSITYTCFKDLKETLIVLAIHNAFTHSGNFDSPIPNTLMKLLTAINLDNFILDNFRLCHIARGFSHYFKSSLNLSSIIHQIVTPPPKY